MGPSIEDALFAMLAGDELKCSGPFRAKATTRNGGIRIAFNIDDFLVFDVHQLTAAYRTVGTDG